MANIEVGAALTDQDAIDAHRFLMVHGSEIALAPIDPVRVMRHLYNLIHAEQGGALLTARVSGEIVGVLGLAQRPFWYADQTFIADQIFYVAPPHRGTAGPALLRVARSIAREVDQTLMIAQTNPNRQRQKVLIFSPR